MYEIHDAANIFPMMSDAELRALADDIIAHGQLEPVMLYEGKVIDGRNRLKACELAGCHPRTVDVTREVGDSPAAYVLSLNLHRRHLNESQRAMVGARAKVLFEAEAKARALAGNARGGVAKSTANLRQTSDRHTAAHDAAALVSVGARSVENAAKVLREAAPEVVRAVEQGKIAVSAAAKIAAKAPEAQAEIVRRVETGEAKNVIQAARAVELEERVAAAPKATGPGAVITVGDAVKVLAAWKGEVAALMLTDPPYGVEVHSKRRAGKDYADGQDYALKLLDEVCQQAKQALADDAHLYFFSGYLRMAEFRDIIGKHYHVQPNPLVWVKDHHGMCDFSQWYPNAHELIWFARPRETRRPLASCIRDVLEFPRQNDTQHSAEKPVALLRCLIEQSTVPGELVLDPFAGSGSTGVAALECGRRFHGIELDSKWADLAKSRLA